MKKVEDLVKEINLLKQLNEKAYIELGMGTIELNCFTVARVRYKPGTGKTPFSSFQMYNLHRQTEFGVATEEGSTLKSFADTEHERETLAKAMHTKALFHHSFQFVDKRFNALMQAGVLSPKTIREALPDFTWRVVISN